MSHELVITFDGDPKDALAALDEAVDLRQAQLNGAPTDIKNLPAHRSDEVRARTQSDDQGSVAPASLVEDPNEAAEEGSEGASAEGLDEGDADSSDDESGADGDEGQASVQAIQFASAAAGRVADEENLTTDDFLNSGIEASGKGGFTKGDVKKVVAATKLAALPVVEKDRL